MQRAVWGAALIASALSGCATNVNDERSEADALQHRRGAECGDVLEVSGARGAYRAELTYTVPPRRVCNVGLVFRDAVVVTLSRADSAVSYTVLWDGSAVTEEGVTHRFEGIDRSEVELSHGRGIAFDISFGMTVVPWEDWQP